MDDNCLDYINGSSCCVMPTIEPIGTLIENSKKLCVIIVCTLYKFARYFCSSTAHYAILLAIFVVQRFIMLFCSLFL